MVANAVPSRLATHVARTIMEFEMHTAEGPDDLFRKWLQSHHDYMPRAAGDVLSRLRRVRRMLGETPEAIEVPADAIRRLRGADGYGDLTKSVRSQMKRAIELYEEFAAGGD
jgi:hypothetical protein